MRLFQEIDELDVKACVSFVVMSMSMIGAVVCFDAPTDRPETKVIAVLAGMGLALVAAGSLVLLYLAQAQQREERDFADKVINLVSE